MSDLKPRRKSLSGVVAIVLASLTLASGATFGVLYGLANQEISNAATAVVSATIDLSSAQDEEASAQSEASSYLACVGYWWCSSLHPGTPLNDYADAIKKTKDAKSLLTFEEARLSRASADSQLKLRLLIAVTCGLLIAAVGTAVPAIRARRNTSPFISDIEGADFSATASGAAPASWSCAECLSDNASGIFCLNCGAKHVVTGGGKDDNS
jgi:hypothetical protein